MKTLKIVGICLFIGLALNYFTDKEDKIDSLQQYSPQSECPITAQVAPAKVETVYVERVEKPRAKVETVYEDPDNPGVYYTEAEVHGINPIFPTGQSRKAYKPGSQKEYEWRKQQKVNNKRYKPDYVIEPVETGQ